MESPVDGIATICEVGTEWDSKVCVASVVVGTGAQAGIAEGSVREVLGRGPVQIGWQMTLWKGVGEDGGEEGIPAGGGRSGGCNQSH